jgi:hypothetical protein
MEFVLGFSRLLSLFLGAAYFGAIIILINCPLPILLKIVGATLLSGYFWQLMNLHVKRASKKSVICIWQDSVGRWGCLTYGKKTAMGQLKSDSFKSAAMLILRFRFKTGTRSIIVPVDALNKAEYRQLYTRLNL